MLKVLNGMQTARRATSEFHKPLTMTTQWIINPRAISLGIFYISNIFLFVLA